MNMTLHSSIKDRILAAQKEYVDEFAGLQKGLDEMIEQRRADKMYFDLRDRYWWPRIKKDIAEHVSTDKTKITRKPSKTGKHGHEERKSTKEPGNQAKKSKLSVKLQKDKDPKLQI
ncbi:putative reverse transcriptase domain-containing protein [Tanacetum coccineum]